MLQKIWSNLSISVIRGPFVACAAALGVTAILLNLEFNLLEAKLYDLRVSFDQHGQHGQTHVVLVTLDDKTTDELNDFAPLALDQHVFFLEALAKYQPKGVGYLVNLNYVNQVDPELFSSEWSERFLKAAKTLDQQGSPFIIGTPFDINGEVLPPFPLSSIEHGVAILHQDGTVFSKDKVTRRALTYLYEKPTFHMLLAQKTGLVQESYRPRGSFKVEEVEAEYFFFRYHGDPGLSLTNEHPHFKRISFIDILKGRVPLSSLKDKIVLVDTMIKRNPGDYAKTPLSKGMVTHPKVTVHADILHSIVNQDGILLTPKWVNWITTFIVTAFVFWVVLASTPLRGVFATLGLAGTFFVGSQILFQTSSIWVSESQPLIGIFLSYYLVVPYRLIQEYRKRWDYQRKNELLLQVEKLKTNFISLVTHDLKTPVARIQGLAEVILSKSNERLIDQDRKSLRNIIESTDELNRFISSVLELTKIQDNRMRLNLESKDLNQLIEHAISSFKAQARTKQIKFETTLEPLFPIKLDRNLISKVLNNLLDNAIKYSSNNSKIYISSREIDEHVELSIRDEGIGMTAEEKEKVFTRFFRAQNDTTTQIIGSGLGLYLSKYFIEAHRGQVLLESEKGKGSTFTIKLPINLKPEETGFGLTMSSVKRVKKEKKNA